MLCLLTTAIHAHMFVSHPHLATLLSMWNPSSSPPVRDSGVVVQRVLAYAGAMQAVRRNAELCGIVQWNDEHDRPGSLFLVSYDDNSPDLCVRQVLWDSTVWGTFDKAQSLGKAKRWLEDHCYRDWDDHPKLVWNLAQLS